MRGHIRTPEVPAECPQELVNIIESCMIRDPEMRPSAKDVYRQLLACPPILRDQKDLLASTTTTESSTGGSVSSLFLQMAIRSS